MECSNNYIQYVFDFCLCVFSLNPANNTWFVLQTNYDNWEPPLVIDDRRTPVNLFILFKSIDFGVAWYFFVQCRLTNGEGGGSSVIVLGLKSLLLPSPRAQENYTLVRSIIAIAEVSRLTGVSKFLFNNKPFYLFMLLLFLFCFQGKACMNKMGREVCFLMRLTDTVPL